MCEYLRGPLGRRDHTALWVIWECPWVRFRGFGDGLMLDAVWTCAFDDGDDHAGILSIGNDRTDVFDGWYCGVLRSCVVRNFVFWYWYIGG